MVPLALRLGRFLALGLACVAASCGSTGTSGTGEAPLPGTLRGRVILTGPLPQTLPVIELREDMRAATGRTSIPDERWVVSPERGVGNVLVTLDARGDTPRVPLPPSGYAVFGKVGPRFTPRLLAVTEGTTLEVRNLDSPCNCFHSYARRNPSFNRATPAGDSFTVQLDRAETFDVRSDLRPYMSAAIAVVDTPHFAVTGPDGSFGIEGLPPGHYRVELWHEEAGRVRGLELEVPAEGAAPVEFALPVEGRRRSR